MTRYTPISPSALADRVVARILDADLGHPLRVALDGPACAQLGDLADAVVSRLSVTGRPGIRVDAEQFYRDASVRLEYGRHDVDSFYDGWLDRSGLVREVLDPAGRPGARILPSLRDPVTNRSTRAEYLDLVSDGAVIVVGELLQGQGLPFDLVLHAAVSRAARRRRTDPDLAWTLPAFDRYDVDVDPAAIADIVVRYDDPARPAIAG